MREAKANNWVTLRIGRQLRELGGSEFQGSGVQDAGMMGWRGSDVVGGGRRTERIEFLKIFLNFIIYRVGREEDLGVGGKQ